MSPFRKLSAGQLIPAFPWLDRLSVLVATMCAVTGGALLVGSLLSPDSYLGSASQWMQVDPTTALCLSLLGIGVVAQKKQPAATRWTAGIACFALIISLPIEGGVEAGDLARGTMPPLAGACCFAVSLLAALNSSGPRVRRRWMTPLAGSLVGSVSGAVLMAHVFDIKSAYTWAGTASLPPATAALLFLLSSALLASAWVEHTGTLGGAPSWLPLPVALSSIMLTLTVWLSLRDAENIQLASKSQHAARTFAQSVVRELELQTDQIGSFAERWSDHSGREAPSGAERGRLSRELKGCVSLAELDAEYQTVWRNARVPHASATTTDHLMDPQRLAALEAAITRHGPAVSGSLWVAAGEPGFAFYAPVQNGTDVTGFLTADVSYRRMLQALDRNLGTSNDHHLSVKTADQPVYEGGVYNADYADCTAKEVIGFAGRRLLIEVTPGAGIVASQRRALPEFALGAGLILTVLLSASVHLARAARSGLRSARILNEQLTAENQERRRVELELRASQATSRQLSLVASRTDNLVIITDPSGAIEWVNESFMRVMEFPLAEVVGRNPADIVVGPDTSLRSLRRIRLAMRRGVPLSTEVVNYSKSGKKYHLHLEIQPVRNEHGILEHHIGIQTDITARVQTEAHLRKARENADAASRAKSDFLASMSHEIRTPMNGVLGMTSLLLDTPLNEEQRDYISTIRTSGDALLTIINDILDFSRIEAGRMELDHVPFEVSACVEDALDLFSGRAATKGLELAYHVDGDVPAWIHGDVTRVRQMLANLINNAVKFTSRGSVSVKVRRLTEPPGHATEEERATLEFSVTDTGIGIPADRLDRLFQPFSQVDSSATRKFGGTGLGLAICHRLCAMMGGSVAVSSAPGSGSTFSFTLRTTVAPSEPHGGLPQLPPPLKDGIVLCITDHPVLEAHLQTVLTTWGARPACAAAAEAAIAFLAQQRPPAAVILDHRLAASKPGADLRDLLCQSSMPMLVLLPTSESTRVMDDFAGRRAISTVNKPVRVQSLIRGLQGLLNTPSAHPPPFPATSEVRLLARDLPLDILLVEDNTTNQKVVLRFLDRLGYRADAVSSGAEALRALQARPYQLVLMDVQMPGMDGFEATRLLRQTLSKEHQPKVLALTANALSGDRERCLQSGMDDYLTKPVRMLDLADAIRRHFAGRLNPVHPG